jgi:cellulose synthase/poly-beta-1,6-N-acetylglucosamine synthase-like glycosyltransferase
MAYNEERNIGRLLEFLLHEMGVGGKIKEILVIASGCTDRTTAIVRKIAQRSPSVRLIEERTRNGKAAAIGLFLRAARFPICVLVNADTLPVPGAVDLLVQAFLDPRVGMVGGRPVPLRSGETSSEFWDFAGRIPGICIIRLT